MTEPLDRTIDKTSADVVQVVVFGNKIWVNVDGACLFRAYRVKSIIIEHNGSVITSPQE